MQKKNENNNETKMMKKEWQTKENCHFYHTAFIANELSSIDFSQWTSFFFLLNRFNEKTKFRLIDSD